MARMFREKSRKRQLLKRVLILCEGETEKYYLDAFKASLKREVQRTIDVNILQANFSEPIGIVKEAIKKQNLAKIDKQPYDTIWLVFDDDKRPNIKQIFAEAKRNNFNIAYSSISIEFWFLLHFERTAYEFNSTSSAIKHLKKYLPKYCKTDTNIFNDIKEKYVEQAVPNAAWLKKEKEVTSMYNAWCAKPVTTMDELTNSFDEWNKQSIFVK
ncbi:MAG: RloB domain-containing protein [Bacteroidales bacterium]|nr:RloB domain-containing protein [Bacteroidales bacterium]